MWRMVRPSPAGGHRQAGGADDDRRQCRDLRQDVNRGELADFDDAGGGRRNVALVQGEAAGADDGCREDRRKGAAEVVTVAAAVHDPLLSLRFAIRYFRWWLLWRGGCYGTNRLSERRLRESIKGTVTKGDGHLKSDWARR